MRSDNKSMISQPDKPFVDAEGTEYGRDEVRFEPRGLKFVSVATGQQVFLNEGKKN
jgi:hypothetical protein